MADPLDRFVAAQEPIFHQALTELTRGRKRTHWMWFIFPQIAGLGQSATARFYAIQSLDEARAYLAHPLLGERLEECTRTVLCHAAYRDADQIFGDLDALKFRSSMTLFHAAGGGPRFRTALRTYFGGEADEETLRLLGL
jgi:uncharacterized protein (DUF1810 family)